MPNLEINSISNKILRFRWIIIAAVALCTVFFSYQISKLTIDADVLSSLPDDDRHAVMLKKIGENFGGNRMGIVILETDNIYKTSVIGHIRQLTDSIGKIEGISSVSSLSNIINIKGGESGIEIGRLVDEYELPQSEEEFKLLRENIASNEMYKGSIVSEDETSCLVVFTLEDKADVNIVARAIVDMSESLNLPEKLYYIGSPMLITYIAELMRKDLTLLLPIAILLIAGILFISFRSVKGVILPLLSAIIAIIWSLGSMSLFGFSMSMISNNIPIILLAIGSAYTIHVVNRVNQLRSSGVEKSIVKALNYVMIPVVLAAITTAIGFVSFIFGAYLEMIVDFGIFTALGTFIACIMAVFFVPSLLEVLPKSSGTKAATNGKIDFFEKWFLTPLTKLLFWYPKTILGIWIVVILISLSGIAFIKRSVDIQEYFQEGNPTREAERIMVEKFGGTKPVFVHFKGNMQNPEVLKTMMKTSAYMEASPDIYTSMSVAKLIAEINLAITGEREVPEDQAMIEQMWFLLDGNEVMNRFVNEDLTEGIIISKFKSPDNDSKIVFSNYMDSFIEENSNADCEIQITGMPFVDITMDQSLINSQMGSISIAIIFVIIIVGLILRSFLNGLYASLPIIAAITILFGVMGLTGISLNIATVLVASVALGIGIDYSIHIISHFNALFKSTGKIENAIQESLKISGKAIIINVVSVSAGFLVLVFSEMVPLQYFGILIAISMVSSSLGAMTLLPALLITIHKKSSSKTS
ncbi:efflux RND transporter permease subunit [Lutimonas zeaxanthinifaciens]|uniref:efflux RND transporter permease subunit n=1 Tax=Lutimonas zeaxanthinifaciens TaxID=3060215 RepID=UPI00265CB343|nr:efflux RND transporter permease subunit [Lutimonas sp. YSD2104]WKK65641.1 MMPL family transporter [Lutimonas sp. YSD2104]